MASVISHPVTFTTTTQHILPPSKYLIPANWARFQLSQLVNKVLELSTPTPFDFLIRGEILHGTIAEWCAERGIKEEETLEIEYFESLMPPKFLSRLGDEVEDWIGAVTCARPGLILAGSYDSSIRLYNSSQKLVGTISGHTGPVISVSWLHSDMEKDGATILSASHDGTARISKVEVGAEDVSSAGVASLRLHAGPLSSISSDKNGTQILTSGWDGLLGVFTTEVPETDEIPDDGASSVPRKKRRKLENVDSAKRKAPAQVLKSHTGKVTKGLYDSVKPNKAWSCGFDSTVRSWDTEIGVCTDTYNANARPMTDIALTCDGTRILAASTDRVVSMYDTRSQPSGPPPTLLHPSFPSCLSAHQTDPNKVISGSYDGMARLWDLRSTKAAISAFEVVGRPTKGTTGSRTAAVDKKKKILSVDWGMGILAVGGEGGVEIWRVNDRGEISQ